MIFRQAQIDKFLKQPDKNIRCVVIYGANEGLIAEHLRAFTLTVVQDVNDAFQVTYLNGSDVNSDVGLLFGEYNAQSLMGGRRVVIIRDGDNNLTKHLKKLFAESNADNLLIITSESLNRKSSLVVLAEADESFACVPCYEDKDEDIYATARTTFINQKITITNEALQLLCARLSNDRKSNLAEIDKLITYIGERRNVGVEDVLAIISDTSSSSIEDVCYFVASGDFEKSQKAYQRLLNENVEPISLIRTLYYHFDKMLNARASVDSGLSVDKAVSSLMPRIIFYRENAFKKQVSFWTRERILGAFDFLYKCERDCKTTNMPVEEIVGQMLLNIAQAAARLSRQ
ncbi:MAG: DNA polymerase III subunit delta [Alphaproteobacteria bacterium]|nr:DNA polymerase III subunit delta [Alphaproteobacteria bacterium]